MGRLTTSTRRIFRALSHRNFRLLWLGQTGHAATMWMDQVARAVLILQLTDSAFMLSLVIAARLVPTLLFGLIAGAVADRADRRKVLLATQCVLLLTYLFLGVAAVTGVVETWQVFAATFVAGTAMAFNQPVRQSLIPMTVPREELLNAIALNSTALSVTRIAGGALAGLLLVAVDVGTVYLVAATLYCAVIATTYLLDLPRGPVAKHTASIAADLREGFRYVAANHTLMLVTGLAMLLFLVGFPYQQVFVPLLATDTLHMGDSGVGFLMGATGVGSFVGSFFVAARSEFRRPGLLLAINMVIFGCAVVALSLQSTIIGTGIFLAGAGSVTVTYMSLTNSIMLDQSSPEMHGRVMSLLSLARGLMPVGAVLGGSLASTLGVRPGLFVIGVALVLFGALALVLVGRRLAAIRTGTAATGHETAVPVAGAVLAAGGVPVVPVDRRVPAEVRE